MLLQPAGDRKCFLRVHWILKHGFLHYRNKQTFLIGKNVLIVMVPILTNKDVFEPTVLKEVSLEYSLKGLRLKLKLQYFLATWCEELTPWKRPWCWECLNAGGKGDDRGWDGWMASLTQWTWVWVGSGSWWQTGRPGVLQSMGSQRVRHDWAIELNWA